MRFSFLKGGAFALALTLAGVGLWAGNLDAADHAEAPGTQADAAADIADLYAWHTENDTIVYVLTYAGLTPSIADGGMATYDADVLYGIHNAFPNEDGEFEDLESDADALIRFGQNGAGDWGMQVTFRMAGFPDVTVSGAVGEPISEEIATGVSITAWAGLVDDPFFFDLQGYTDTLATGALAFDPTRDSLAGTNVSAIVIEAPALSPLTQVWATTARDTN